MESTIRLKTVFVLPLLLLSRLNLDVHVDGQDRIRTVLHAYTYREVRTPAPHLLTCGLSSARRRASVVTAARFSSRLQDTRFVGYLSRSDAIRSCGRDMNGRVCMKCA